jgi:prepilin-type N-terminal cleavage/methylation domain-containing protein
MKRDERQVMSDERFADAGELRSCRETVVANQNPIGAFTLLELLVVISIMGLIAALAVPALKALGKSNVQASAARQMLDDVGRARQLAVSEHTTVYMIFVPTNFWCGTEGTAAGWINPWWIHLTTAQQAVATNLCDKQLTGYTFVSLRSVGDQPGQGKAHYLDVWKTLPEGTFIAQQKFQLPSPNPIQVPNATTVNPAYPVHANNNVTYWIYGFNLTNNIPFPTEDSRTPWADGLYTKDFGIPYIAFNYQGQLTIDGQTMSSVDEYIPLADGSVSPMIDPYSKMPIIAQPAVGTPTVTETPPGNSTNSMYHIIHIDRLSGRATLEFQRVQ